MTNEMFSFEEEELTNPTNIKVIGVGGGGNNAVSRMKQEGIRGVEFIAVNTDTQDLKNVHADQTIQIGEEITNGLGSGADPNVGQRAAQENRDELEEAVKGTDLLFLTAGMGGGTGTGASPVIAEVADEMDILTIGVVTRPFNFEKEKRAKKAEAGIQAMREHVDTLIIVPNQRIFDVVDPSSTPLPEAFRIADEVLKHGVHGISEVIVEDGYINVDFADVRTIMEEQGDALMGIGEASGEEAAEKAAERAINSPLLETNDMTGAQGVLINIAGGESLTLEAIEEISEHVNNKAEDSPEVIEGAVMDPSMDDQIRVTVIATGFSTQQEKAKPSTSSQTTSSSERKTVLDPDNISSPKKDIPAHERQGQVEVAESDPDEPETSSEDEDDDLSIPTFMRVSG
jgi:cell division protein FtsZ